MHHKLTAETVRREPPRLDVTTGQCQRDQNRSVMIEDADLYRQLLSPTRHAWTKRMAGRLLDLDMTAAHTQSHLRGDHPRICSQDKLHEHHRSKDTAGSVNNKNRLTAGSMHRMHLLAHDLVLVVARRPHNLEP